MQPHQAQSSSLMFWRTVREPGEGMLAPINMHVHLHIHAVRGYYAVALQLQIQAANPGKCGYMLQATTSLIGLSGMLVLYILMLATYTVSCSVIWLEPLLESVSAQRCS
jgi:hypothetical protein